MSDKPVTHEVKEAKLVKKDRRDWSVGSLFWGLLLVLVGGLLLADNFDWLEVRWGNIWMLWPLLIIAAGLSMLSIRNIAWKIMTVFMTLVTIGFIAFVALGDYQGPISVKNYESNVVVENSDVKTAKVILKAGASKISVSSATQDEVVKANLESNSTKLVEKTSRDGSKQTTELVMESFRRWWFGGIKNDLNVVIGRTLPTDLTIDYGAADADIDLSQARITNVSLKTGASSTVLKLGDAENVTSVSVDSGASSITIRVPSGSGVRLNISSGLTSNNLADLENKGKGVYESPGYSSASKVVNIDAKIGVASFTVERY